MHIPEAEMSVAIWATGGVGGYVVALMAVEMAYTQAAGGSHCDQ